MLTGFGVLGKLIVKLGISKRVLVANALRFGKYSTSHPLDGITFTIDMPDLDF